VVVVNDAQVFPLARFVVAGPPDETLSFPFFHDVLGVHRAHGRSCVQVLVMPETLADEFGLALQQSSESPGSALALIRSMGMTMVMN
jgi:hypothetical protein